MKVKAHEGKEWEKKKQQEQQVKVKVRKVKKWEKKKQ